MRSVAASDEQHLQTFIIRELPLAGSNSAGTSVQRELRELEEAAAVRAVGHGRSRH